MNGGPGRGRWRHARRGAGALLATALASCGGDGDERPAPAAPASTPASFDLLAAMAAEPDATGTDVVGVWVCAVPADTRDPTYVPGGHRLDLDATDVVQRAGARLARYFSTISHGRYTVDLVAGGTIELTRDDTSDDCVDRAIYEHVHGGHPTADVLLAVADAEHTAAASGGWGSRGDAALCGTSCTLATSRRAAYVGASDFHDDWGAVPALDLVEHELGHTLGLPHSGAGPVDPSASDPSTSDPSTSDPSASDSSAGDPSASGPDGSAVDATEHLPAYGSALDLMSDSAAPRAVDPTRRDGPDILGIGRVALGWLPLEDVAVVGPAGDASLRLHPSTGPAGTRLAVVPLGERRLLTIELLPATGFDAHLPAAGVAVHLVEAPADDPAGLTTGRIQRPLVGAPPFTDLLTAGEHIEVHGWRISVAAADDAGAHLAVEATAR